MALLYREVIRVVNRCAFKAICQVLLVGALLSAGGCSRSAEKELVVGPHHLRLVAPSGWEHLDHGRVQIFRHGEVRISLADLAPAAREGLSSLTPDSMAVRLFEQSFDARRMELVTRERRAIHGTEWTVLDAWDRATHLNRTWLAFVNERGNVLVLQIDRGPMEAAGSAFEQLLESIEIIPDETPER